MCYPSLEAPLDDSDRNQNTVLGFPGKSYIRFICLFVSKCLQFYFYSGQTDRQTLSFIYIDKEVINGAADVAKGVGVVSKQRPPILEKVEKLFLVYVNEVQLRGDNISESFICEKALEIYDDLVKKNPWTSNDTFEFRASRG